MSKNNQQEIIRKMEDQRQRFSLRKYGVGVASVLIGLTFMGGYTVTAHADTQTAPVVAVQDSQNQIGGGTNSTANQPVADSAVSSQTTASQATSDSAVKSTSATSATPAESNVAASSAKQTEQVAANKDANSASQNQASQTSVKADSSAQAQSVSAASLLTNLAAQPASENAQYNVNDWNYTTNTDGSGITITGYKGTTPANGAYYIPNSYDFRQAGKIHDGQQAMITVDTLHGFAANNRIKELYIDDNNVTKANVHTNGLLLKGRAEHGYTNSVSGLFQDNTDLTKVDFSGLDTTGIDTMANMFSGNTNLTEVTGLDNFDTSSVRGGFGHMFANDVNLTKVSGMDNWDVTHVDTTDNMFLNDSKLTDIGNLSHWSLDHVSFAAHMFDGASALENIGNISNWGKNWDATNIGANRYRDLSYLFNDAKKLNGLGDLGDWKMSAVGNTSHMFNNNKALTSIGDLSGWNLKNDTDASYMFNTAERLNNIGNIGGWFPQGSKVTNMVQMFNDAGSLTSVGDISGWDTSNVTNMGQLFREAVSLKTIGNLDNWNVSNVTYMAGMFQGVPASSIGDLSNWDTNKVANMDYMFATTPNLTSIGNLNATDHTNGRKGWNNSGALEVAFRMFMGSGIKNVDVSGWKFSNTLSTNNQNTYIGPTTLANRNNAIFADLVNPATITMNGWQSDVTANLHAADFDGGQPLIVISDDSNLQNLNNDEIKADQLGKDRGSSNANVGTKGHVANTITFVAESESTKSVASQRQDFVFANEVALKAALNKIPTDANLNTVDALKNKYVSNSGKYLNGKHNATQTPAYEGNYGKIAGTYSVEGKTQDVTQDLINDPTNPDHKNLQKASAVYRVVECFPDYYKGEGTLNAQQYADTIGDSANTDKYKGYVYKIKLSQPITAYRAATKNLLTGDINYDGPYSLGNSDLSGSIGLTPDDRTHANMALDHPENYDISSSSYYSPELDSNQRHVLNYTFNAPTATAGPSFSYDLVNGYQMPDENKITFTTLPTSRTFYVDYTAQTKDVTQQMINDKSYPADHMKKATYQVVEKFPASYKSEGTLSAAEYAKEIGDSDVTKYDGYVYKIIANQTVTAYQTAIKNLATGEVTYTGPYNAKYLTYETTTPGIWDHQYSPEDKTYIGAGAVDQPAGYTISSDPDWKTPEKDANGQPMVNIYYISSKHAFHYDFMIGTSDTAAKDEVKFDSLPDSHNFYINYTADKQTVIINYVDTEDNNKVISSTTLTGTTAGEIDVPQNLPTDLQGKYELDGTIPATYTFTADSDQTITVKLKHATETIDKDAIPEDAKNDNGTPLVKDDFEKQITRTITAKEPQYDDNGKYIGTKDVDLTQTVTLTRTATLDKVTNQVVKWGEWSTANFDPVNVPEIAGYTAQVNGEDAEAIIPAVGNVTPDYQDPNIVITYSPNEQPGEIKYVDEQGNVIKTTDLSGKTDETVTIDPVAPAGWKIVSGQDIPTTETATANGIPPVTVKVEHATITVQPNDPKTTSDKLPDNPDKNYPSGVSKEDLNKTITRTITITNPDKKVVDKSETLSFERTATVDEVTGEVTYGDWTPVKGSSASFGEMKVPEIPGYTASQDDVPVQSLTNDEITNWQDNPIKISYAANEQSITITYNDKDGNPIKTDTVNGMTDETINTNSTVPAGWKLIEGEKVPSQINFTYGKDGKPNFKDITVTIEHATVVVQPNDPKTTSDKLPNNPDKNYPSGVSKDDLNKTITRTVKITNPDGTVEDKSETLSFERTATVDEVTGEVTYGDWTPVKGSSASFGEVNVPEIPGYTASQDDVPVQSLTNDEITNWQDNPITISYAANSQSTEIIYQTVDGEQIGTTTLNGVTDQTVDVNPEAPEDYWIDKSKQHIPATYTFKASDNQPITVIVVKKEDSTLPPTTDDKDAALIIQYQDQNGKVVGTQIVTGKVGANEQIKLNIPDGYYSSHSIIDHTFKANDSVEIISVTKKEEGTLPPTTDDKDVAVVVEFKDQDGKVIGTQVIEGNEGTTGTFDLNIPDGYYSSSDELTHTFKPGDSTVTVNVTKKEEGTLPPTTDDKDVAVIVEFKDQAGKVVGTQVIEGNEGTTGTFDLNIPDGYYSSEDQLTHTFKPGDSTVTVDVTKKEESKGDPTTDDKDVAVLVEYTDPSGKVIKTDIISGKPGATIQVPNDLPAGYQTTGDVPTAYTIGKGDHQVVVINVTPINADSGSAQPDQPSSGSDMPSSSADSAIDSNSAAVTPSEPTSAATASSAVASDAPATSASAAITGQAVVTSATPTTAAPAQSQATQGNLPQTGNDSRKATSIAGLALASLAGILGLGAKRKKED